MPGGLPAPNANLDGVPGPEVGLIARYDPGTGAGTVRGHLHETRVTLIDPATRVATPRHLNPHVDYDVVPSPPGTTDLGLALPVSADGTTLYLVALGSDVVATLHLTALDAGTFAPDAGDRIAVAGGPGGLVVDERAGDADLGAPAVVEGVARGWVRLPSGLGDRASETPRRLAELGAIATNATPVTWTAVPPGTGVRRAVDRDADGYFDGDERDAGSDPTDPASTLTSEGTP